MWRIGLVLAVAGAAVLIGTGASAQVADPPAPEVPALALQKAQLVSPTQLALNGTIDCTVGNDYTVSAQLTELGSQTAVRTSTVAAGPCTVTGPQNWAVTVTGTGGSFVPVVTTFGKVTNPATRKSTANADQRGVSILRS